MRIILACLLLYPFSLFASSVGTTTTFAPGDTLTSADLNGNLSALTTAIDDNDSRITAITNISSALGFYDNGQRIATVISEDLDNSFITLLSDTGYIEKYTFATLAQGIFFLTTDCTGQAYSRGFKGLPNYLGNGMATQTDNTGVYQKVYFTPGSTRSAITSESTLSNDLCTTVTTMNDYFIVFPNDQVITGLPTSLTGPFTIGNQ